MIYRVLIIEIDIISLINARPFALLVAQCKDDGVYEYLDEQSMTVSRSTRLNNPDATLAPEQNDTIHGVALKQLQSSRFAVDAEKALMAPSSSSHSGGDGYCPPNEDEHPMSHQDGDGDNEDDDDMDDLDPQPFSMLFQRLAKPDSKKRAVQQSSNPSAASKRQRMTGAGPNTTSRRNRTTTPRGDDGIPEVEPYIDDSTDQGREDASLIQSYILQFRSLKHLDCAGSDDQSFAPWIRTRSQKLQDLKTGIRFKVKSLKRRLSNAGDLKTALEDIQSKISNVQDFFKLLAVNSSEGGREPYDELERRVQEDQDYNPSDEVWKRCLRSVAFEDISTISC